MTAAEPGHRPELVELDPAQRKRARTAARGYRCPSCHSHRLAVGDAIYVGFLFRSEDIDAYFVALTCRNRRCPTPHTGVRLRAGQFLVTASDSHGS